MYQQMLPDDYTCMKIWLHCVRSATLAMSMMVVIQIHGDSPFVKQK